MIYVLLYILLAPLKIDIGEIRELFTVAADDETACNTLFDLTDGYTIDYKPVVYAYHAAAEMTKANHASWPGTKMGHFKTGKYKLEAVVQRYDKNVEIRYIRFAVQFGSPSFLGYRDNLEEDKRYIKKHLEESDLPEKQKKLIKATIAQ